MPCTVFTIANHSPTQTLDFIAKSFGPGSSCHVGRRVSDPVLVLSDSCYSDNRAVAMPSRRNTATATDALPILVVPDRCHLQLLDHLPHFLVFLSMRGFLRNLLLINSIQYHFCFVHGPILRLLDLHGVVPLDYSLDSTMLLFGYTLTTRMGKIAPKPQVVEVRRTCYIKKISKLLSVDSLLTPFMTLIYSVSADRQKILKTRLLHCLLVPDRLTTTLFALQRELELSQKLVTSFAELLSGVVARRYMAALSDYYSASSTTAVSPALPALCAKHNVSKYEMGYILSILSTMSSASGAT